MAKVPCVVIYFKNKPIGVVQVQNLSSKEIFELEKQAEKNLSQFINEDDSLKNAILERIDHLEKEVKYLKGEDYNLCGNK